MTENCGMFICDSHTQSDTAQKMWCLLLPHERLMKQTMFILEPKALQVRSSNVHLDAIRRRPIAVMYRISTHAFNITAWLEAYVVSDCAWLGRNG